MRTFVTSVAALADLTLLVDLRDGVVHAGLDETVEERLLVAFVQQTDATLADLGKGRGDFWGDRLAVVDALLDVATDKVARRVLVKLAAAKAAFDKKFADLPQELQELARRLPPSFDRSRESSCLCPACESDGVAQGWHSVDVDGEIDKDGIPNAWAWVVFTPSSFACTWCGLRLDSPAELKAARVESQWPIPDLNPSDFESDDDDAAYEAWRDSRLE